MCKKKTYKIINKGYLWIVRLCLVSLFFPIGFRFSPMHAFYNQSKQIIQKKQKKNDVFSKQFVPVYVSEHDDPPNELLVEDPVTFMY